MAEGIGHVARQVQSASGIRYFAGKAMHHFGTAVADRRARGGQLGYALAHTCRAARLSSLVSIRPRRR
jgi:hypothetical protein